MSSMRITIPKNLPSDPAEAYRMGWNDRKRKVGSKGGSAKSDAKAMAAKTNGAKGGRPKRVQLPIDAAAPKMPACES